MIITKFYPTIPECMQPPCKHKTCRLWDLGYRVSMRKFWIFKWLEWKPPTMEEEKE
jgi:hypothetical protein